MTVRINEKSFKNVLGTVFLLATVFFVCSTFISMRSVFADPIAPANSGVTQSGRQSPRSTSRTSNKTVSRSTVSRSTAKRSGANVSSRGATSRGVKSRSTVSRAAVAPTRTAVSRSSGAGRTVSSRSNVATRSGIAGSRRNVSVRGKQNGNRSVVARGATNKSRISATGNVISSGSRASANTTYSYLASRLNTGNYSNIVDSTTGMIAADAYSNCMDSYYTCMDEICTARSSAKGRCSCAGRAKNFLASEQALERANEELITLSGQLALLISTKGKADDLTAAFSLTDAEKVMNCVSWREMNAKMQSCETISGLSTSSECNVKTSSGVTMNLREQWCKSHPTYKQDGTTIDKDCKAEPYYCKTGGNDFNFDLKNIDGSSSDILAQLQAWADAKDLARNYEDNTGNTIAQYITIAEVVDTLSGITTDISDASLDSLANKWGYELFEYSHNNVCSRVLDSCFNGIYEACGTPPTVTESDGVTKHAKCTNGSSSNCPFNYNSYISVDKDTGDVKLNERSSSNTNSYTSASCFGYSVTTSATGTRTTASTTTSTTDPYYALRGPVADARRSIMQKYLLDANAACDTYGENLKKTAQNINYQKVAAEQSLQQKRLEFKTQERSDAVANAQTAIDNFSECLSEIWDCYDEYKNSSDTGWTTARIKSYCSQVAQVPHCYEPMICSPLQSSLTAVIDKADASKCTFTTDYSTNTCRNLVTISEILYGTGADPVDFTQEWQAAVADNSTDPVLKDQNSAGLREGCLQKALNCGAYATDVTEGYCLRNWSKSNDAGANTFGVMNSHSDTACAAPASVNGTIMGCIIKGYRCNAGYVKWGNQCVEECASNKYRKQDGSCAECAQAGEGSPSSVPLSSGSNIEPQQCVTAYDIPNTSMSYSCTSIDEDGKIGGCIKPFYKCNSGYVKYGEECKQKCPDGEIRNTESGECETCGDSDYSEGEVPISNGENMEPSACGLNLIVFPPNPGGSFDIIPISVGDGWQNSLTGVVLGDDWIDYFGDCNYAVVLSVKDAMHIFPDSYMMDRLISITQSVEPELGTCAFSKKAVVPLRKDSSTGKCLCPTPYHYGDGPYYFEFQTHEGTTCLDGHTVGGIVFNDQGIYCTAKFIKVGG